MARSLLAGLGQRRRRSEWMDQPDLEPREHVRALRGLHRVNLISRSDAILWPAIARLSGNTSGRPLRVLDLACGGGSVTVALARRARRTGCAVEFDGCDRSPTALRFARQRAEAAGLRLGFHELDVLHDPLPTGYDVVCCSLFLHHLDEAAAVKLLRTMRQTARHMVLVNDLIRSRVGYVLAGLGTRLLSRSPIVHHDGLVSVEAAFTPTEVLEMAERAGLHDAVLTRHWPQRFLLAWEQA